MGNVNSNSKNIFSIIFTTIQVIIIVLLLSFSIFTIATTSSSKSTFPADPLFNCAYLTCQSDSMDPTFKKGDLIISKAVSEDEADELKVGDIITFLFVKDAKLTLNTHRIVDIEEHTIMSQGKETTKIYYVTQGDKYNIEYNHDLEENGPVDSSLVSPDEVRGKYVTHLSGVGGAIDWLKTPVPFFMIVILPLILLFIYNGYVVIKTIRKNNSKKTVTLDSISEDDKKRLLEDVKKELLEELKKNDENNESL